MLYTRKGDTGTSGLIGTKERFEKDSDCYEALGTLDELNCLLGLCRSYAQEQHTEKIDTVKEIKNIQENLFIIQAELAGSDKSLRDDHIKNMEHVIDSIEQLIPPQHTFVIPGETRLSAWIDYARTVSRRAERIVLRSHKTRPVSTETCKYLNRLSSLLYALARFATAHKHVHEAAPSYQ
jgi:cob(I)alamin adenosyltransferase